MPTRSAIWLALLSLACGPAHFCGDGLREGGESCDLGAENADDGTCTTVCRLALCGDGLVGPGEACDDGNTEDTDACRSDCQVCGDGVVAGRDRCDDANDVSGDGCERCLRDGDARRLIHWRDFDSYRPPLHLDANDQLYLFHPPLSGPWVTTYTLEGERVATIDAPLTPTPTGGGSAFALDGHQPIVACAIDPDPTSAQGAATHVARFDEAGSPLWVSEMERPSLRDDEHPGALASAGGRVAVTGTFYESRGFVDAFIDVIDVAGATEHRATARVRNEATVGIAVDLDSTGQVAVGGLFHDLVMDVDHGWIAVLAPGGTTRWLTELDHVVFAVALRGAEVFAVTTTELERFDALSGAPLGTVVFDVPPVVTGARFDDGHLLLFGGGAEVGGLWISVHDEDGGLLWSAERDTPNPNPLGPPLTGAYDGTLGDDHMLYALGVSIVVFDPHL